MASTADIKNGLCIEFNHDLWQITEFMHVKPGKGAAFVRTKMKSLTTSRVQEHTFPSGTKIETITIERRKYLYSYKDDMGYNFMNSETFEQVAIPEELINAPQFMEEGMECDILFHADNERALVCELPSSVVLQVTYTEPGVKGDTATNTLKPATVSTGATVMVPLFVDTDTYIKINTAEGSYMERVKM